MSKRKTKLRNRQPPKTYKREDATTETQNVSTVAFLSADDFFTCLKSDYVRLDELPEVVSIVNKIAELLGSMTIYLMKNTKDGDIRLKNELSRFLDIQPSKYMNRSQWVQFIGKEMLLTGNCVVRPKTREGLLTDLQPIPHRRFVIQPDLTGYDYKIVIDGVSYSPENLLHFPFNPDRQFPFMGCGLTLPLGELSKCLKATANLEKDFMTSKYFPSVIVKIDSTVERFQSKDGRKELAKEFIETDGAGEPWIVPADQIDVKEIRPFSLADLAIDKTMEIDRRTLAALFGVPAYLAGVGEYNQEEWNNFISTKINSMAQVIAQEISRKLIISPEWYVKFNHLSLYNYDLETKSKVYMDYADRGYVNGQEARDAIGILPGNDPALKEFMRLENYIPAAKSGEQGKLK